MRKTAAAHAQYGSRDIANGSHADPHFLLLFFVCSGQETIARAVFSLFPSLNRERKISRNSGEKKRENKRTGGKWQ